jgi:hypothetical protein
MTEKQREQLAENPKEFLKSCWYHEKRIEEKQELIRHYRELAESITAEIKEVTTFSLTPSHKVENCAIEILSIQDDIRKEIEELKKDIAAVREVIDLLDDSSQKLLMEARYLRHMKWEDIMELLDISYRWTLRLHGIALQNISEKAMLIHV